ncbi:MAG TPA: DUF333 domain-containing protein [Labilithrix sp.]|nr:DUF333 domain-containing protein [Labilithrix sp.]
MIGLGALLSLSVACAAPSEPAGENDKKQTSNVDGEPTGPAPSPTPAPAPAPAPAPVPTPACTALAAPNGSANPAAVFCGALGYTLAGDQCTFPDATSCEQWAFFRGECGQAHSFCNLHGGTVSNKIEDMGTWTASYALCTLPGGKSCQEQSFAHSCSCE